jgi:LDH2 family malate/lactate/ureidoglycolate dehydrogenase
MDENAHRLKSVKVQYEKLERFVSLVFQRLGMPVADAAIAARVLVMADLRGVDSHGVIRLSPDKWYVKAIRDGIVNPNPRIRIVNETPASALIEGDGGMGMVVGQRAVELAIEKARRVGVGVVAARNSRHFGMAAYYAMLALPHDMIGISMTNAGRQVVPTFGQEAKYGTNPLCLAAPTREEPPFVLDMATTTAAAGKLEVAAQRGNPIPLGWALDEKSAPTADPRVAQQARKLLPLGSSRDGGSHKGYGLAIMVEILCGALTGSLACLTPPVTGIRGHFFGAIDISRFRPVEEFKQELDTLLRDLKSTTPERGQRRVYAAGEIEHETALERSANGIPLHLSILERLRELSRQLEVPYDLESSVPERG